MKHLVIISPSLKIGGIQRALVALANYYVSTGFRISFITCFSVPPLYVLDERVELISHSNKRDSDESLTGKLSFYGFLIRHVRKQVKELKPDAVLTFGDIMGPFVLASLYGLSVPVYIGDRTSPDYKFKFPIPLLKKLLYPTSAGFFAQTSKAAEYRRKEFGEKLKITVLPNGIRDVETFNIKREKVVLYVGRFAWEKAPDRLIKAFSEIDDPEWTLEMAGDGPLLADMKNLAKDLQIDHKVKFLGQVANVDLLYSRASIFVLPSVLEGFPNALCEAMASGLPSICFDSIPYSDILTDGYDGFAVKSGDIEALRNRIRELMKDEKTRMEIGENAKAVTDRLSIDKAANTIYEVMFGTSMDKKPVNESH